MVAAVADWVLAVEALVAEVDRMVEFRTTAKQVEGQVERPSLGRRARRRYGHRAHCILAEITISIPIRSPNRIDHLRIEHCLLRHYGQTLAEVSSL